MAVLPKCECCGKDNMDFLVEPELLKYVCWDCVTDEEDVYISEYSDGAYMLHRRCRCGSSYQPVLLDGNSYCGGAPYCLP